MSVWWLLPLALAACLAVVAIAACLAPKPRHAAPRHLAAVPEPMTGEEKARLYGSMILGEERALVADLGGGNRVEYGFDGATFLPAGPDWREQTAADLSPEALEDSGPGGLSSLTPGPDLYPLPAVFSEQHDPPPSIEFDGPWGTIRAADFTRLADTADVMDARLLAEVEAMMRAQDDDAALYCSRFRSACAQYRLDLAAALA